MRRELPQVGAGTVGATAAACQPGIGAKSACGLAAIAPYKGRETSVLRHASPMFLTPSSPSGESEAAGHPAASALPAGLGLPGLADGSEGWGARDWQALAQERGDLLQLLMTHAPIGIFQTEPTGHLIRTNARWRQIARLSHVRDPRGLWWQMVDPADRDRVVLQWEGALRHGYEFRTEFRIHAGEGQECHARTRIVPVCGVKGVVMSCVGVSEDITERRRLEADLRQAQEDLEARIRVRTRQLELANRELGQFAYLVAHDLKAPLRAVSHLADWVARDYSSQVDVKGHELLGLLRQRVRYMHDLIEGVLTYARLGGGAEADVEIDVGQLVGRVLESLELPAHCRVVVPPDLPRVMGVMGPLQQVFQNLIENAIKFMDKPEGIVTLRATRLQDAWQFAVADNGPGIDARHHERIFGLFQRLRPEIRSGSTGVGLALVKKTVEARGGEITLDSSPGQGSTFAFTWPDKSVLMPAAPP